jgi:hypothetical protein
LGTKLKNYLPAFACALIPVLCYLLIRPYAEFGICDDPLYIKDAQKLALTGRIVYSGAEGPMLGWQLYLGALLIKLFGFSFTAVRFSTVIEAMATAFLLQRTFLRAGINSRNATLATVIFVLSPLHFPYVYTFMSDVSGVLGIVACIYMCLRALDAKSERSAIAWIVLAALSNAVGGTARQIVWFGVLVIIPCTVWLLRRNRRVLVAGCASSIAGACIVMAAMHWFAHQPLVNPGSQVPSRIDSLYLKNLGRVVLGSLGVLTLFALPVLLLFAGSLRTRTRYLAGAIAILSIAPIYLLKIDKWPDNAAFNAITSLAVERLNDLAAQGMHLAAGRDSLRIVLTGAAVFGLLCLVSSFFASERDRTLPEREPSAISWPKLAVLLGPFSVAYILLIAGHVAFYDRYFMPLLVILLLVLTRYYQQRVSANLPWASVLLVVLFGGFSLVATHDAFASYRGYAAAASEIQSGGVLATAILGPDQFEWWTELNLPGYINDPHPTFKGAYTARYGFFVPANCEKNLFYGILLGGYPDIQPEYAVSANPRECGGQVAYPPVTYRTWIAPQVNTIYALRLPPSFPY